jgi:hypothetical protein
MAMPSAALLRAASESGDHDGRRRSPFGGRAHRDLKDRTVQANFSDRELGCVHADGEAASARIEIITSKRPLPPAVKLAFAIQCKRMSRYDSATPQCREYLFRPIYPAHLP